MVGAAAGLTGSTIILVKLRPPSNHCPTILGLGSLSTIVLCVEPASHIWEQGNLGAVYHRKGYALLDSWLNLPQFSFAFASFLIGWLANRSAFEPLGHLAAGCVKRAKALPSSTPLYLKFFIEMRISHMESLLSSSSVTKGRHAPLINK